MEYTEFTGKTTEEALQKARDHFGKSLDELEVQVIQAGSAGLFGLLGRKDARVKARPMGPSAAEQVAEVLKVVRDDYAAPSRPRPAASPAAGGRSASTNKPHHTAPSRPAPAPAPPVAAPKAQAPSLVVVDEPEESDTDLEEAEETGAQQVETPEVAQQAVDILERLCQPLDPTCQVSLSGNDADGIHLLVQGQEAGVLIGRKGQTLDAIQYLATRIISHQFSRPVRLQVDAGGYRQRRQESLEELAQKLAAKAVSSGRSQAIGPLSAQERRLVHVALRGTEGICTVSRGRGELKKVVISKKR